MRVDPVSQLLGLGRLGVGEATGAEHGDKQLDAPQLPRAPVDQTRPLAGEVDERLLAGAVHLPHRRPQPPGPLPVDLEELGAAVAARMNLGVLLPEELQGDAVALELAVDVRAVGPGSASRRRGAGKQPGLERRVVQLGRQRPAESALSRPPQIAIHRPHADGARLGHRLVGQSLLVPESQNLPNLPHQQPPCRHRLALLSKGPSVPQSGYRRAFTIPGTDVPLPPDSTFHFPDFVFHFLESIFHFLRIPCSTSSGIGIPLRPDYALAHRGCRQSQRDGIEEHSVGDLVAATASVAVAPSVSDWDIVRPRAQPRDAD